MFNYIRITSLILLSFFVFKCVYVYYGLDKIMWALLVMNTIIFSFTCLLVRCRVSKNIKYFNLFLIAGIFSSVISAISYHFVFILSGLVGTYLCLMYWLSAVFIIGKKYHIKLFYTLVSYYLFFGVITAISCVYQYFFDYSLLGFNILHRVYSNELNITLHGITKRATSFMGGPQNLGLYMGFCILITSITRLKTLNKFFLNILFTVGGLLSGSSAFFAFVFGVLLCRPNF